MVARKTFREDLWYRISVFPIHLPPLRERLADIPAFAAQLAARAGKRLGGHELVPTPADIAMLQTYSWPGNVRELAAVIERAAILGNGKHLEIARALGSATVPSANITAPLATATTPPVASLEQATIAHIEAAAGPDLGTGGRTVWSGKAAGSKSRYPSIADAEAGDSGTIFQSCWQRQG